MHNHKVLNQYFKRNIYIYARNLTTSGKLTKDLFKKCNCSFPQSLSTLKLFLNIYLNLIFTVIKLR